MSQISLPSGLSPTVFIESVHGKLEVKGWDRPEILLKASSSDDPVLEQQEQGFVIRCAGNCMVRVPKEASLRAGNISGNASFKMLEDGVQIELVAGSLVLRDLASASVARVHGELLVRQVEGDLRVEEVYGSATARDVQGACVFQRVGGNLVLRDAEGNVDATALGNAHIQLAMLQGDQYTISASGNLECRITEDASAQVELASGARSIRVRTSDGSKNYSEGATSLTLGSGASQVKLSAGGNLSFACEESDWSDAGDLQGEFDDAFSVFSEQFSEQIGAQIEAQMELLDEQMSNMADMAGKAGFSADQAERIRERAREISERANAQAQEKMRRAQDKLQRKMAAAQRKVELRAQAAQRRAQDQRQRTWNRDWPPAPPAPPKPPAPASDEERLMILRMLEQKKISLEEAEKLLAALENSSG